MRSAIVVGAALLGLCSVLPTTAAEQDWVASQLRGTVLFLTNDEWQEVTIGQSFGSGAVVRTLQAGDLVLTKGGQRVSLGPGAALGFSASATSTLVPYGGTIEVATSGPGASLTLAAPGATVTLTSATVRGVVKDRTSVFTVVKGRAEITDQRRHKTLQLGPGDTFNSQFGATSGAASPSTSSASPATANGSANQNSDSDVPSGSGTDHGNGKDNGNHNGAGNGKGNGNGKSGK